MQRQDTIRNTVSFDRIAPHVSPTRGRKLQQVFGPHPTVWGSRGSGANRTKFNGMLEGDEMGHALLWRVSVDIPAKSEKSRAAVGDAHTSLAGLGHGILNADCLTQREK